MKKILLVISLTALLFGMVHAEPRVTIRGHQAVVTGDFGPRRLATRGCDFHRGIDLRGGVGTAFPGFTLWDRVTVYYNGALIYGIEPHYDMPAKREKAEEGYTIAKLNER
ncbi:MAG TPA: hypothetical protein ENN43_07770 [bacterium]|nr:hypothetical protein [bacterium]